MFDFIINFFDTLIIDILPGNELLDLFDQYFLSQTEVNQVLLISGASVLIVIGLFGVIKWLLKVTMFWLKFILFLGLAYYVIVVLLGIDVLGIIGL
jgi:hypothetical protein